MKIVGLAEEILVSWWIDWIDAHEAFHVRFSLDGPAAVRQHQAVTPVCTAGIEFIGLVEKSKRLLRTFLPVQNPAEHCARRGARLIELDGLHGIVTSQLQDIRGQKFLVDLMTCDGSSHAIRKLFAKPSAA
jgi:hypothetical protein